MHKKLAILALLTVTFCVAIVISRLLYEGSERGKSVNARHDAESHLQIGMRREEVIGYLRDAWKHTRCEYQESAEELFLFGSRDPALAAILYLVFARHDNSETLTTIAHVENYRLFLYADCREIKE